jgi:F420-dependent oxidoreductase-like protein
MVPPMNLGINLGYWGQKSEFDIVALACEAEALGFSVAWVSEAYSSDAITLATWIAAHTTSIDVGTAVLQIPARSAATTAMSAATLDRLSGGRFRLGLGVSSPPIAEGWHGQPFSQPLKRAREYVEIVRLALNGKKVMFDGEIYRLPLPDSQGGTFRLQIPPIQKNLPIYLASVGPKSVELAGEIADGWIALFYAPEYAKVRRAQLATGALVSGRSIDNIDVVAVVSMVVGNDPKACADVLRGDAAIYFGGISGPGMSHYGELAAEMGFSREVAQVRRKYSERDYLGAAASMPFGLIDATALLGTEVRIAERMAQYASAGVTTLSITPFGDHLEQQINTLRVAANALGSI